MPVRPRSRPSPTPDAPSALARRLDGGRAPRPGAGPSAEFRTVPPHRQARVARVLRERLENLLPRGLPAEKRAAARDLLAHVGAPDFYERLAVHDVGDAKAWRQMAQVQREFARVEPEYDDKTRAYSESMRLTLHAAALQHFVDPASNGGQSLYARFIALHPTAFHQNGGWLDNLQIPLAGAVAVAAATPGAMWLEAGALADGALITDAPTTRAAQLVRQARREALGGWGR